MFVHAVNVFHPLLAAYRGWGWGWWWWWWIVVLFFVWLLWLPPFGYGRRWYGGYRTLYGGAVPPADFDAAAQWQEIEAQFVSSPAGAVIQADNLATRTLAARGVRPESVPAYRSAHEIAVKAQRGNATTDELRSAMMSYRSVLDSAA